MADFRTFIPNNRPNSDPDIMTRMQKDLSTSSHSEGSLETNGHAMAGVRRVATKIPHVCVVGAGVAGLRCADVLLQHGVKVTILEGRNRVGGRLYQSDALGHKVDLKSGPNWIHGTDNNPVLDLAKETNTLTMNWDGRQSVFDKSGNQMDIKEAGENSEIVWGIIEQAMKYSEDETSSIPVEESLFDFFKKKVPEMITEEMEGDTTINERRETILDMSEMWGAFVGSSIERQSLRYFWLEECIDGENLFVAETYHKILNRIAEPVQKCADIKFGHKVQRVVSKGTEENPSVEVLIDGQESLTFDEVVMTAPLGWLQRNESAFEPELPDGLKQAIASIGYGHLDKVYITFPTAFWNESTSNNLTTPKSHDHTIPNVPATTAPIHQASSAIDEPDVNPNHYPGFTHWRKPAYAASTNPAQWAQEALNLAALPPPTAHPTLLFYTYGPTSLHLASLLKQYPPPVANPDDAARKLLTDFFHPYFSRLPNYSPSDPAHQPSRILATTWANDELAGYGSYCNFQVGLEAGDRDIETMRRGMPGRGLWFAGEHTAPFVALGTVTGAYWAGEGVARRIVRAWGVDGKGKDAEGHANGSVNGSA
ncbi:FAD/NAD(P)-binding domain-containing protein [Bimuria novae-zelandiae CBS 107.79]|uniref:FAD/NAD(P)-binding domain-containing protein n=1 Tax=Bimuria novae-zelandiae CBS 107.79 TaxID=1447943 RepID=A0A6A5USD6_9PLEO|nr:FAD/NAD(P)-binding domain-containing protein [Bimuria novae-zelandiae CBS 107.79]